ncbi:MAG: BrnT family toxin [Chloroflexota bacterium]
MRFEWDHEKARTNAVQHGITFEEAATVFGDPLELTISDPDHSSEEDRFISIGSSVRGRLLVVGFTERRGKIRVIFARRVSARERREYEEA